MSGISGSGSGFVQFNTPGMPVGKNENKSLVYLLLLVLVYIVINVIKKVIVIYLNKTTLLN